MKPEIYRSSKPFHLNQFCILSLQLQSCKPGAGVTETRFLITVISGSLGLTLSFGIILLSHLFTSSTKWNMYYKIFQINQHYFFQTSKILFKTKNSNIENFRIELILSIKLIKIKLILNTCLNSFSLNQGLYTSKFLISQE